MSRAHLQRPRTFLANCLDELWQAAGAPTLDSIARSAQRERPPASAKVTGKRISAWRRGNNVPQSFAELASVVHVLAQRARSLGITNATPGLLDERQWHKWWMEARNSTPLSSAGTPSTLGWIIDEQLDPFDLEVHHAINDENVESSPLLPTYIERQHDRLLRHIVERARAQNTLVVLVGGSSTGKTRSCWEAVQCLKGWRLWHPVNPSRPSALLSALERGGISSQTVLWLNEMQFYLKATEFDTGEKIAAGLRELLRDADNAPILVLGTLWPEYWDTFTRQPDLGESDNYSQCRALLSGHKLKVPDSFEETDETALPEAAKSDQRVMRAVSRPDKRVAQFLAGAFELLSRYESAPAAARALIDAAIDASRLGVDGIVPETLLKDAAPGYLTDDDWNALDDNWLANALEYTGRACLGVSGPLSRSRPRSAALIPSEPRYKLADFIEEHGRRSRQFAMPPGTLWNAIANLASSAEELLDIAYELHYRGRYKKAASAYLMAADAGDIRGLTFLADCRRRVGDKEDAEAVLQVAAGQGSLLAYVELAELRHEGGDSQSAREILKNALFDRTIESDDRFFAWRRLVDLCEDSGDSTAARRWLKQAASEGDNQATEVLASLPERHHHSETMRELVKSSRAALRSSKKAEKAAKRLLRLSRINAETFAWTLQNFEESMVGEEDGLVHVPALVMLGRTYSINGNYDKAEEIFLKAVNALNDDYIKGVIPPLVELVKVLKRKGDRNAANRLWKYGLELDGSIAAPWRALDQRHHLAR
jgi:tetratricopeptide (TPR) repeat protein